MDRTSRMMRRTILCAAFACPLGILHPYIAYLVWILGTVSLCFVSFAAPLWIQRASATPLKRILFSCASGLFLSALLPQLLLIFFPRMQSATLLFVRGLAILSGLTLQNELLYRIHFVRKKQLHLSALFLFLFIVCMLSGG